METKLLDSLSRAFPERKELKILSLERIPEGWESEVYIFRLGYALADESVNFQDLVLRIYPGANLDEARRKADGETRALRLLYQCGYPVPQVFWLETLDSPFTQPAMIMEKVDGVSMWPVLYHDPNPAVRQRALVTFCRLFVQLHHLDWRPHMPAEILAEFEPTTPTGLIDRLLGKFQPVIQSLPLPGFAPLMEWVEAHKAQAAGTQVSPVHWDFHPNNVLVTPEGQAHVIDWTGMDLTDYRFDLAWTLILILSYEGKQAREAILREYERQAGCPVEHLAFYEVIASLRRLYSIAASVRYGAEQLGMRPGAEKIMLKDKRSIRRIYALLKEETGIKIPEVEAILLPQWLRKYRSGGIFHRG